jgi:mono/diheme cytochrome c family protein
VNSCCEQLSILEGSSRSPGINEKIIHVIVLKFRLFRWLSFLALSCYIVLPLQTAYAAGAQAAAAGATLFRDKGCAYCHGASAEGTQKGPSLANVRKAMKPAQIASQIENGGQKMPSFSDSLSHDEVAQLVAFLRAKHRPAPAPLPEPAKSPAAVSNPGQ